MKKLHRMLAWMTVFALLVTLVGCGDPDPTTEPATTPTTEPTTEPTTVPTEPPLTADTLIANINAAMSSTSASRLYIDMAYDIRVTEGDVTQEVGLSVVMETRASVEPFGSYTLADMAIFSNGFEMSLAVESYTVEEEGTVVTYAQAMGYWTREDSGMTVNEYLSGGMMSEVSTDSVWSGTVDTANMTLEPTTTTVNGSEAYVLHTAIKAEQITDYLYQLGIEDPSVLESISTPVTFYVDAENWLILRMEVDMNALADIITQTALGAYSEEDLAGITIEIDLPPVVCDLNYGAVGIPAVPQEAYDQTANGDSSLGEEEEPEIYSTTVFYCGDESWEIVAPEEWYIITLTDNYAWCFNEEYSKNGEYSYETTTHDDFMARVQDYVDYLTEFDCYVSHGEGPAIEGYETWEIIGQEEAYYFALRQVGDGWLCIQATCYGEPDPGLLSTLVGFMTPYAE